MATKEGLSKYIACLIVLGLLGIGWPKEKPSQEGKEQKGQEVKLKKEQNLGTKKEYSREELRKRILKEKDKISIYIEMLKDPNWAGREAAILLLSRAKDPRAIEPLIETMLNDDDPSIRAFAAQRLSVFHSKNTIPAYKKALLDSNSKVKYEASDAILEITDKQEDKLLAYKTLRRLAKDGYAQAVNSFVKYGKGKNAGIRDEIAKQILLECLTFPSEEVRINAAAILRGHGINDKGIDKIIKKGLNSDNPRVKDLAQRLWKNERSKDE